MSKNLLLSNLTIIHAGYKYSIFPIITDVMISLAFIQFSTIVLYHFLIYTCHCNVVIILVMLKENLMSCVDGEGQIIVSINYHYLIFLNVLTTTVNMEMDLLVMTSSNSTNKGHQISICHSGFTTPV